MGRGFQGVQDFSKELSERKDYTPPPTTDPILYFGIKDGEVAEGIRFLEQDDDIHWAMVHEVPVAGRDWGMDVPCLDQERDGTSCPGCEQDLKRSFKGYINVIWPNAPVYQRDENGRLVKDANKQKVVIANKTQVAVWSSGIRVFEELDELNANYRGLKSRRFNVKRKGTRLETKYKIFPTEIDGGAQEFSEEELALEKEKHDLNQFVIPGDYDDFQDKITGGTFTPSKFDNGDKQPKVPENPFMSRD